MILKYNIYLSVLVTVALLLSLTWLVPGTSEAADVTVNASVATSVSCAAGESPTAFGEMNSSSVFTSAPNTYATTSCTYAAGCLIQVDDAGDGGGNPGLYKSGGDSDLIASASATLAAGTEGYGIQIATSTQGTGAALTIDSDYIYKTGNNVAGLLTSADNLATSDDPFYQREIITTHKAAISVLTKAGSYTDTITYSCTGQ